MMQVAVIKLCRTSSFAGASGDSIEKRFQALEAEIKKLQELRVVGVDVGDAVQGAMKRRAEARAAEEDKPVKRATPLPQGKANEAWKKILDNLKKTGKIRLFTCLISTRINEISDDVWEVEFPNGLTAFNEKILQDAGTKNDLMKEVLKETGKEIMIKYKDGKEKVSNEPDKSELNSLDIDVNIIE